MHSPSAFQSSESVCLECYTHKPTHVVNDRDLSAREASETDAPMTCTVQANGDHRIQPPSRHRVNQDWQRATRSQQSLTPSNSFQQQVLRADTPPRRLQPPLTTCAIANEMTQHALLPLPLRVCAAYRWVILLLLTFAAGENAFAAPRRYLFWRAGSVPTSAPSTGYLAIVGPPPLRFASASPVPESDHPESVSEASSRAIPQRPPASADAESPALRPTTRPEDSIAVKVAPPPAKEPAPERAPAPIALDDLHPNVRAEDFLPYFQIPGSSKPAGELVLIVPPPRAAPSAAPIPPSSATYTQTPK